MSDIRPPDAVIDIMRRLKDAGHTCYVAGGAVRDLVMGRVPADWDIASSALPADVERLFPRTVPTGIAHGTVTVLHGGMQVEVTTYRQDGPYSDGRHPDYVSFAPDIRDDLARRDFTMNAMAYDPIEDCLVDPFGGREHIRHRLIVCVGDPMVRFTEDKLRMVRAARFASTLGFDVHPSIVQACSQLASEIVQVAAERIIAELMRMMEGVEPSKGLALLDETGLLAHIMPDLAGEVAADRRRELYAACDSLPQWAWERWALVLSPIGPERARQVLLSLRASRHQAATVYRIMSGAEALRDVAPADGGGGGAEGAGGGGGRLPEARQLRQIARQVGADALLSSVRVFLALRGELAEGAGSAEWAEGGGVPEGEGVGLGGHPLLLMAATVLASNPPLKVSDLAINGKDIMAAAGLESGPAVRRILERLLDEVILDPAANTRDRLIELAVKCAKALSRDQR